MVFKMTYDVKNDIITDRWNDFFRRLKTRDFSGPMKLLAVEMYVEIDRRFSTESDPRGRKWAAIGSKTAAGAGKSAYAIFKKLAGKARILVFSGQFRKAFISRSGTNSVFKLTRSQIAVGSSDRRANTLHFGDSSRNIPARGIVGITNKFEKGIVIPIFDRFLKKGWNG